MNHMHYVVIVFILLAGQAFASPLQVGTRTLFVNPNAQGFVTVTNTASSTQYFRARIERIEVNAEGKLQKVTAQNPKDLGLLVVPVNAF